jgi:predicted DCC family thiol-disulfide oxidoreductase YuxK
MSSDKKITIYYDGLCHLCSREMQHYQKMKGADKFLFVDISDPLFDAAKEHLDAKLVHKVMHVRTAEGELCTGMDAFIVLWEQMPQLQWLARLAHNPLVKPCLNLGYCAFAAVRPYLPKRKQSCSLPRSVS